MGKICYLKKGRDQPSLPVTCFTITHSDFPPADGISAGARGFEMQRLTEIQGEVRCVLSGRGTQKIIRGRIDYIVNDVVFISDEESRVDEERAESKISNFHFR